MKNLPNILTSFSSPSYVCALSIEILTKGSYRTTFACVSLKKEELFLEKAGSLASWGELESNKLKDYPIALFIHGKGMKQNIVQGNSVSNVLPQLLPNANVDDFNIDVLPINEQLAYGALIRTEVLNDIIDGLKSNGALLVQVSLGDFYLSSLNKVMGTYDAKELDAYGHKFTFENDQVATMSHSDSSKPDRRKIDDTLLDSEGLRAYAGGLSFFMKNPEGESNIDLSADVENYAYKRIFEIGGWSVLAAFFAILLLNFLIFDTFRNENNQLSKTVSENESAMMEMNMLKKEIADKEGLLKEIQTGQLSRYSKYADELAETVPAKLNLDEVSFNPTKRRIVNGEPVIEFEKNKLLIKGIAKNTALVNDWIHIVKSLDWIQDIDLTEYYIDKDLNTGKFEITIQLNPGS